MEINLYFIAIINKVSNEEKTIMWIMITIQVIKSEEDFVRMHGQKEEQRQHHSAINPSLILSHFPHKQVW